MKAKKVLTRACAIACALSIFCGITASAATASVSETENKTEKLKIAVLSDTHYLSPTMIKDTEDYETDLNSDRKIFTESDAILSKMLSIAAEDAPDVLLISGDLTKDGELENHQAVAQRLLALQSVLPELKIYVVPGNHDLRNENGKNFNTADGKAVAATRTEPEDFKNAYSFIYNDESVVSTYTPPEGKEAGGLSYAARPREGYTVIAIDSCRYSSDNTQSGENEHETSGAVSADLEAWVLEQIAAAKDRGDVVMGLQHHGLVPHFSKQNEVLPMYLVKNYYNLGREFADAGMSIIFTGHMHANDISALKTFSGNKIYDIETGSALTYPSPMRLITLDSTVSGAEKTTTVSVKSVTGIGPISYTNAVSGQTETIENLTNYGRERGITEDMLKTVAGTYICKFFSKYFPRSSSLGDYLAANTQGVVSAIVNIKTDDEHTLLEYVNYIYQSHLAGQDSVKWPTWVENATKQLKSGKLLDKVVQSAKEAAFGNSFKGIKLDFLFTRVIKKTLSAYLTAVVYSMGCDSNYAEDNDTVIVLVTPDAPAAEVEAATKAETEPGCKPSEELPSENAADTAEVVSAGSAA